MSYEYKELIKTYTEYIMDDYEVVDYIEAGKELDHVYRQAAKADEYEAENKELLEELNYLKTVNNDLVWQRDTDEEHEAKSKAWDRTQVLFEECTHQTPGDDYEVDWHEFEMKIDDIINKYESGGLDV